MRTVVMTMRILYLLTQENKIARLLIDEGHFQKFATAETTSSVLWDYSFTSLCSVFR